MAKADRRSASPRAQVHYMLGDRMSSGDLVFHQGQPTLVVSWRTVEWKRVPYIWFPLDGSKLKPSTHVGVYLYEGALTVAAGPLPHKNIGTPVVPPPETDTDTSVAPPAPEGSS
jgi:hypothetical protein